MTTPESLLTLAILTVLGLLLLSTIFRLRYSNQATVLHLAGYAGLLFLAHLAHLMDILAIQPLPDVTYAQLTQLALLASILVFGASTLSFLQLAKTLQTTYWISAVIILLLWSTVTFQLLAVGNNPTFLVSATAAGWLAALGSTYAALGNNFAQQRSSKHRNRLRYWLIATTLIAAGGLIFFFGTNLFFWTGSPLLVAGTVLTGYVVLSYHTPDLGQLLGRALRLFSTTALLAAIFYLALAATVIFSRSAIQPINVLFWSLVLAILLAIITPVAWQHIYRLFTRMLLGRRKEDETEIIRRFSRSISSALDMQRLGDILIKLMVETFNLKYGAVFINERGASSRLSLRLLAHTGLDEPTLFEFAADSLFTTYFRAENKYLFQYDIDVLPKFAPMNPAERAWLSDLKMEFFVPILRYRDVMGILAFGPRAQRNTYHQEDVDLAVALADQAVLAIDSARLFEQLASINQEMGSLNEQLEGLDRNKSDFLSIASHELRTPLTHIHGYSRMLLDLSEEEAKDFAYVKTIVEGVARGSERMKNIIDMMFDVTEANVGEMNLFLGPVNLAEIIRQASGPFLTALDERRIAFDTKGFDDLPTIEADGSRLVQALENLLSNAIKYTPDNGLITIEGQSVVVDGIGSAIKITVADTGIGIDQEHHDKIFEKFFRVDDPDHHSTGRTKFKGAGPGLGLTLVKGIVEAHGGKVWVESERYDEENCPGSKFFLIIPLHPATAYGKKETRRQSQIETVHWNHKLSLEDNPAKRGGG